MAGLVVAVWAGSAALGQASPAGQGLDALGDEALYSELARRGLTVLLERALEQNHVPEGQRAAIRASAALASAGKAGGGGGGGASTVAAVQEAVGQTTRSAEAALATERDPKVLFEQGVELMQKGVTPALQVVEYWGETTQTMARLRPVAQAASALLARSAELARKTADEAAAKLDANANNQAALEQFKKFDEMATGAEFRKHTNDYAVVASLDPADPNRAKLADETVEYLKQYDTTDWNIQAQVRLTIGKTQAAKGACDEAIATLDSIVAKDAKLAVAPTVDEQFAARYFAAAAANKAGRADEATRRLDELAAWAATAYDARERPAVDASVLLLRYRIDAAAKRDAKARDDLLALFKLRPDLEGQILDQLATRVSATADVQTMDLLDLKATLRRGESEAQLPDGAAKDPQVLERGIRAGREIVARKGAAGITDAMLEDASIKVALQELAAGKNLDAANQLMDYLEAYGATGRNSKIAMDEARRQVVTLHDGSPEDPAVGKAYDRFLGIAVGAPFLRRDLAFAYGRRLQAIGKYAEAARRFAEVPEGDPNAALARFYRMVALKQVMDDPSTPAADKGAGADEILRLAKAGAAEARDGLAKGESQEGLYILAWSQLSAADVLLRQRNDAKGALAALDGIEGAAGKLKGGKGIEAQALNLRVLALMALGRNQEATETLVKVLDQTGGDEGVGAVFGLMRKLGAEFDDAQRAGDKQAMLSLARSRAALSGFLAPWAEKNANEKIRSAAWSYRLMDAETKRLAADLEPDAEARRKQLEGTLELFRQIQKGRSEPSALVDLNVALVQYDLGDYEGAQAGLGQLLNEHRLGRPTEESEENGVLTARPNERYWEATLKLYRSTVKLADAGKAPAEAKKNIAEGLKADLARWGKGLGGPKWAGEFEKLRQEIAPDYVVPDVK